MSRDNKHVLIEAVAAFNRPSEREHYFQLYADSAVLHRAPPLSPGIEPIKQWYRSLWAAFPDVQLTLGNVLAEGAFVANEFRLRATHLGPFLGNAASGKSIDVAGVTILRFEAGKCVERWSQTDLYGMLKQIGAV
jgi:predicted ester cyclase